MSHWLPLMQIFTPFRVVCKNRMVLHPHDCIMTSAQKGYPKRIPCLLNFAIENKETRYTADKSPLYSHDFFIFFFQQIVDLLDVFVMKFLQLQLGILFKSQQISGAFHHLK